MLDFEELPYAEWGNGEVAEQPKYSGYAQYGLYSVICDRFVITYYDPSILVPLSKILSSRCRLDLCRLDTASNYTPGLLDNSCCLGWTMNEKLSFTRFPDFNKPVTHPGLLIEKNMLTDDLLVSDRQSFIFALHCVIKLEHHVNELYKTSSVMQDLVFGDTLDLSKSTDYVLEAAKTLQNSIYRILYTTYNFNEMTQKIQRIINQYDNKELTIRIK